MASQSSDKDGQPEAIQLGPVGSSETSKFKQLVVDNASITNLRLYAPGSDQGLFYVDNAAFNPKKYSVTLHTGPDKLGPVLGVAHLAIIGPNTIGLGDPNSNASSMVWEQLSCVSKWTHATYQFEFIFGEEGRKSFIWNRLRQNPFDDQGDYELYEEGKPDIILAKYVSVGVFKWKRRGKLYILDGCGYAWELMVILTGLSLLELSRRRSRQRRH